MTSRHLVDPELTKVLDLAPDMSVSAKTLDTTRATIGLMTAMGLEQADPSVEVTTRTIPGHDDAPDVGIRIYRPEGLSANAPVIYQIHGGGFLFGTSAFGDPRNRAWAKALGVAIVAVDYRVAPEHPYPAALDDCYAGLEWLYAEAPALGFDRDRIAVRGESAGGGLAAALCLMARDRNGPGIAFQLLIYPMIDDRTVTTDDPNRFTGEFVWDAGSNAFGWTSWLGHPAGLVEASHYAAPARATDLAGLPPTMIATAALDMFVDENLLYARQLIRSGVPTEVYVAPGGYHGFEAMAPDARISRRFTDRCFDALRAALGMQE